MQMHDELVVETVCRNCGEPLLETDGIMFHDVERFCSQQCAAEYHQRQRGTVY